MPSRRIFCLSSTSGSRTHRQSRRFELRRFSVCVPCQIVVEASPMGFEPMTSCVTGRRALRTAPRGRISGSGGTRTHSIPGSKPRWSANCLPSQKVEHRVIESTNIWVPVLIGMGLPLCRLAYLDIVVCGRGKDAIARILPLAANVLGTESRSTVARRISMVANSLAVIRHAFAFDDRATDAINDPANTPLIVVIFQLQRLAQLGKLLWDVGCRSDAATCDDPMHRTLNVFDISGHRRLLVTVNCFSSGPGGARIFVCGSSNRR